ncbi:MAG TPA: alpha-amylase family glycosyl hydrolase [Lacunisphaera sp.]|nr:alpha-amylase family glycosyl hydrolase [Lacunisphaera sp.]
MKFPLQLLFLSVALLVAGPVTRADSAPVLSVPRFTQPGAGQVYYFLLTDRFANGDRANDTGGIAGGPEASGFDPSRIGYFHGGDFAGLTARLDYIKGLGATVVWVTPPFRNKPMQLGSASYHGYWILDFLHVDPHLGTDAEFKEFVRQAHARGLKVCLDIVINHTADVIKYQGGRVDYVPHAQAPYRDAAGRPFDPAAVAYNGLNSADGFPALSAATSFAYVPFVPPDEAQAKNPAWLNDPVYYHNRGNSTFAGESALDGDFVGLDDVFTEQPAVVRGFIAIYEHWMDEFGVDGFRIDTARHVNLEFWQAFAPAIRAHARAAGQPGFIQFGEVANGTGDVGLLSEFSTVAPLDASLDFGFMGAAIDYVSKGQPAKVLAAMFDKDDLYTDHDSNVQATPTFLGNHDAGRFGYFLQRDNPKATPAELVALTRLGHALLFAVRGQPVIYYGDEQGMIGRGGGDMQAREDMFASQAPDFRDAPLLDTLHTGADDKFDPGHPLYRFIQGLAKLRGTTPALNRGAMLVRPTDRPAVFAVSRFDRDERLEYLAVFNNSRTETLTALVPTSQPSGAVLRRLTVRDVELPVADEVLTVDASGRVSVKLGPLGYALWRAEHVLPDPSGAPAITFATPGNGAVLAFPTRQLDGNIMFERQELRAEVSGGDGLAEVTFLLNRASRPGQYELLGVDDAPPYRVYWAPPPDLAPGEKLSLVATVDDRRGHRAAAQITGLTVDGATTALLGANLPSFGTHGAKTPQFIAQPSPNLSVKLGQAITLTAAAKGSGELEYQWLHDGREIPGATHSMLTVSKASAAWSGSYRLMVHGLAGTTLSNETAVTVTPVTAGRLERLPQISSQQLADRRVDVWLPPGYDEHADLHYPVLYMHDGQNIFDPATSYGGTAWEVDQALCRLVAAGKARPAIIVGVWNTPARFAEYMPQKATTQAAMDQLAAQFHLPSGPLQSDAYLRYLVTELKPVIDRTYRTAPGRADTFIMGSSMGGLISAYALVEYPDVFGGAGCVSTHWPAGDGSVIDYLAGHLPKPGSHKLYFDFGTATLDAQYEPYQQRMDAVMRKAGYTEGRDWITRKYPGAEHSEKSWRERVEVPLQFLLGR